jgi:hypothetical protein
MPQRRSPTRRSFRPEGGHPSDPCRPPFRRPPKSGRLRVGKGGRLHPGTVAGFTSESLAGFARNTQVSREGLNFDICAAPFGTGYFFSWWLAKISRAFLDFAVLLGIALVGVLCLSITYRLGCAGVFMGFVLFFGMLFGAGFLVRYGEIGLEPTVLSMPITGFAYGFIFRPVTYFNEDTATMFRESVHHAVTEAIDQVTSAQGMRGLSEEARKIDSKPGGY